jgi:hypothetical protein
MTSISSCYQAQLARKEDNRRHTNISASCKKPRKQSLTSIARVSVSTLAKRKKRGRGKWRRMEK